MDWAGTMGRGGKECLGLSIQMCSLCKKNLSQKNRKERLILNGNFLHIL